MTTLKCFNEISVTLTIVATRPKDVLPNIKRTQPRCPLPSPLAVAEWSRLLLRDVIFSQRVPLRRCRG